MIHGNKTGFVALDQWYWNMLPDTEELENKVNTIKTEHLWLEVRDLYRKKKDMYLRRSDHNHSSFNVYIETINEIYDKHFR